MASASAHKHEMDIAAYTDGLEARASICIFVPDAPLPTQLHHYARLAAGHEVVLVHELLANAPADRAWRRRGLLVLCRAWLRRSRLRQEDGGDTRGGLSRRTRSRAKLARSDAVGAGCRSGTPEGGTGDEWRSASRRVVELEEGIFRSVVGFL
ncbi:unnamed protein product [Ectocarpus sp. CCAP 1310/34]|nr:unnamed protein product [Ectocarpus sp. CCAP 1310/34]